MYVSRVCRERVPTVVFVRESREGERESRRSREGEGREKQDAREHNRSIRCSDEIDTWGIE